MKKVFLSLAAIMAIAACDKPEVSQSPASPDMIFASIESETSTRTYMDEFNNILWSENDQIVSFVKSTAGCKYQIAQGCVGKSYATFDKVSSDSSADGSESIPHVIAYYPYSASVNASWTGSHYTVEAVLPAEQKYALGSFGNGAMPMVALSEDNDLTFRNLMGGIKIQLCGTQKVVSIRLEGNAGEKLSGVAGVTVYVDEAAPVLVMNSEASGSVVLDCGEGVQLDESEVTEFVIALPPVLLAKGFSMTVTDSDDRVYAVTTQKANAILRSSLLVMPPFTLGDNPSEDGSVDKKIYLDRYKLTLATETSYTVTAEVDPLSGDQTVLWTSSNPAVARVDADGRIYAVSEGETVVAAVASGAVARCTVTVMACRTDAADYIVDGVNYGKGIAIGDVIWAPVNCGYEAPSSDSKGYPYGKLYQWGRKYGQGYSLSYDASVPELMSGAEMTMENASREKYANVFFTTSTSPYDWMPGLSYALWNAGTESSPKKTSYDPCPEGWRVPTRRETGILDNNTSGWIQEGDQKGYYFSGNYTYQENAPKVFLPASGYRSYRGDDYGRNSYGYYWVSAANYSSSQDYFTCHYHTFGIDWGNCRSWGMSIRCVQE